MIDLETATKTLAELEQKQVRLMARGVELGDERSQIALAAHTGDANARKRLDALNREISTHYSEVDGLHSAIKAQEKVVEQAKRDEATAQQRDNAKLAEANYRWLIKHGPELSHHEPLVG